MLFILSLSEGYETLDRCLKTEEEEEERKRRECYLAVCIQVSQTTNKHLQQLFNIVAQYPILHYVQFAAIRCPLFCSLQPSSSLHVIVRIAWMLMFVSCENHKYNKNVNAY